VICSCRRVCESLPLGEFVRPVPRRAPFARPPQPPCAMRPLSVAIAGRRIPSRCDQRASQKLDFSIGFNAPSSRSLGTLSGGRALSAPRNTGKRAARSSPGASGVHAISVMRGFRRHNRRPVREGRLERVTYRRAPTGCLPVTRSQASRTAPLICSHADVPRCS